MQNNIIISSRIRFARNFENFTFPRKLDEKSAKTLLSDVFNSLDDSFECKKIKDMPRLEREYYLENHLISKDLIDNANISGLALSQDSSVSIMVNEEDHLRLQCLLGGMNIKKAYDIINDIDTELSTKINFAYDKKWGYLTACPGNLGTGMRASVMLFLPALTMTNNIGQVATSVGKMGLCIRGAYGESSGALGDMYQISNQYTLGKSEQEIIQIVESTVLKVVDLEIAARQRLIGIKGDELADSAMRAYGILTNCYKLSSREFLTYMSELKLGVGLGYIKLQDEQILNELMDSIMPANLNKQAGRLLNESERDKFRAEYVSKILRNMRVWEEEK